MKDYKAYARGATDRVSWLPELPLLLILLTVPFFQYLGKLPLLDPDEGRYAEISREMLERGDLLTPTLNYVNYFEKPPLLYWCNAVSLKLFGLNEFGARFPTALAGLLTVLAVYLIARYLYDRRTALLAAGMLATSAGFVLKSRFIQTDAMLTLWLTSALGAFLVASQRHDRPRDSGRPWYLFYLFSALAVLTQGLVGIGFPVAVILLFLLWTRRWELLTRMRLGTGLPLFLAVTVPWFVMVALKHHDFRRFWFACEQNGFSPVSLVDHTKPFWYFFPALVVIILPWSCFIPGALGKAWREQGRETGRPGLYLLIWATLLMLFFSRSSAKPSAYIMAVCPPLAILISHCVKGELERRGRGLKPALRLLGVALVVLGLFVLGYCWIPSLTKSLTSMAPGWAEALNRFTSHYPDFGIAAGLLAGGLLLFQGTMALIGAERKPGRVVVLLLLCSFLLEFLIPRTVIRAITQAESSRDLALKTVAMAGTDTAIITFDFIPSFSWYAGRRVLVTGKGDAPGGNDGQRKRSAWFPDREAVLKMWGGASPVLIILEKNDYQGLRPSLNPAPRLVMESGKRFLISNR